MSTRERCRGYLRIRGNTVYIGVKRNSDGQTLWEDNTGVKAWAMMLQTVREEVQAHELVLRTGQTLKTWNQLCEEARGKL